MSAHARRSGAAATRAVKPAECLQCEIRHLALCSAVDDPDVQRLQALVTHVWFYGGQTISTEGDPSEHVYNVASGTLRLYKLLPDGRRQVTGFLYPGDFLGLASIGTYAYSAEAVGAVHLCRFRSRDFKNLCDELPKMNSRLLEIANDELAAAQEQMLLLGRKTAVERIASFFLHLADQNVKLKRSPDVIDLPMRRGDIADYLGLTSETVSRTLRRLKSDGVIALPESNRVVLSDADRLRELAEEG
jgi:CRP/FNR family transcriptional regulator